MKNFISLILTAILFVGCFGGDDDSSSSSSSSSSGNTTAWGGEEFQVAEYAVGRGVTSGSSEGALKNASLIQRKVAGIVNNTNLSLFTSSSQSFCDIMTEQGASFPMTDEDGCTVTCGSGTSILGVSCEAVETEFTCENTYALSGMTYSGSFDFSDVDFTQDTPSGEFAMEVSISGAISGGSFSSLNMSCELNFSMDVSEEDVDLDCSSVDSFSCDFGSESYTCEELDAMDTGTNTCG